MTTKDKFYKEILKYIDIVKSLEERRREIGKEYLTYITKEIDTYGDEHATALMMNTIPTAFIDRVKDIDEKIEYGKEIVRTMKATYNNIF